MSEVVAFIGLGNMGRRMAARLVDAGYYLRVYDTELSAVSALEELGATGASSPVDAVEGADFVLSSLPNPAIVRAVYSDDLMAAAKPGAVLIDFSTIDPVTAISVAEAATSRGLQFLDAPVSRGVAGAESGTLAIMVGGDAGTLEKSKKVLSHLGNSITHVGPSGSGQMVKLCNNMLSAINVVALGEVLTTGLRAGLSTETMYEVFTNSSADSHMLSAYFPRAVFPAERVTGFSLDFMLKDIDLFLARGNQTEIPMLLSGITRQVYRMAQDKGLGSRDSCSVVEVYEELGNVRITTAHSRDSAEPAST